MHMTCRNERAEIWYYSSCCLESSEKLSQRSADGEKPEMLAKHGRKFHHDADRHAPPHWRVLLATLHIYSARLPDSLAELVFVNCHGS